MSCSRRTLSIAALCCAPLASAQPLLRPPPAPIPHAHAKPTCTSQWSSAFGTPGMDTFVSALGVFDVGNGPTLYAGGTFFTAGGVQVNHFAQRVNGKWAPVGGGLGLGNFTVHGMTVFDDGTGPALYVGGEFSELGLAPGNGIARWNGTAWSKLAGGVNGSVRGALAVFDDGAGPALYVGGDFSMAGGVPAGNIARWDGASWSSLGAGVDGGENTVRALAVFDDGRGPALFVAGHFTTAGGLPVQNVARWDGRAWSDVGGGVDDLVRGMRVHDDGSGPALYLGGEFQHAGGTTARHVVRWDGRTWTEVGGGMNANVRRFVEFDDGTGPALYAAGNFTAAGGEPALHVARWDGVRWSALGAGLSDNAFAIAAGDDGTGPSLYLGGSFTSAGGWPSEMVARWFRNCAGDANCDGAIDAADLAPLMLAIDSPAGFAAKFPGCSLLNADANRDGVVDESDLPVFLAMLKLTPSAAGKP